MKQLAVAVLLGSLLPSLGCKKPAPPTPAAAATAPGAPVVAKPMPAQIPPVVARVNGETIQKWEFDDAVRRIEARAGSPMPVEKRDELLRGVLDQLVAYHLIAQESRARKMGASDADVDARVAQIKGSFPNEDAFQKGIAAQGLTIEQVRTQARMSLDVAKFLETEVAAKVAVTDVEVDAFYKQNLDRFKQADSVHARHILIGVPQNATADAKKQARVAAQAVVGQLKRGAPFEDVAKKMSSDTGSAQNGGDLGFFPKGQMTPAFEKAAFALKPGETSGIVETPFGFHIIRVLERRDARTAPFEEVSGQIKEFLTQGQREKKLEAFVTQIKTKAKIEILV
jgi:peptidyl-prolyl cis-trans isomerase C